VKSSFFSQSSLCVYIYCDLSSCAQSMAFICWWGKKRRRSAVYARSPKRRSVFWCAKTEKAHTPSNLSFHLSFRPTAFVRSCEPQNWSVFFPFFAYFQACRTQNSSFLKHRIHPKHGSGRTSSLTRSNTRKCISSSFYFVFSFVEFFFTRAKLSSLFFLSV